MTLNGVLVVLVLGESAFGLFLLVHGVRQIVAPYKIWRSMRKRSAWEFRDRARAQDLEPSADWVLASRAKGAYTIVLGLIFIGLGIWLVVRYG